ncbi:class I SAM-dependent methyltransferase [Algoriphagus sp. AGSA1]|uniref:methyltransferase domain-containing protein n=1 Tax=Algoriphagus sp. AGSA1 TaxID=2907213 RepID=UPI001F207139|nr:methyltransferase domain-containing protein [Algoriphagus sp. AGSA1]MCE7058166.1 class I SAM-dependent methyltransferase [Algoriphagus sp. AGSA1]
MQPSTNPILFDQQTISDEWIDQLYPIKLQKLSGTHWTPVEVAKKAISFLTEGERLRVLDLGSGSGKFCLVAASLCKDAQLIGVEQQENLVHLSRKIAAGLQLENLTFVHSDLLDLDFSQYDSFYFFNAFEELINFKDRVDKSKELDEITHQTHIQLLRRKFEQTPPNTRIVTYCGECAEIPYSFALVRSSNKGKLKFWEKR